MKERVSPSVQQYEIVRSSLLRSQGCKIRLGSVLASSILLNKFLVLKKFVYVCCVKNTVVALYIRDLRVTKHLLVMWKKQISDKNNKHTECQTQGSTYD